MQLPLLLIILLAFPVLELVLLFELARAYGWWVLAYLAFAVMCGLALISGERLVMLARIVQTMQQGRHPLFALLMSARTFIAGALLIFPGVLSDILAIVLLLIPLSLLRRRGVSPADEPDVIEAEWRRED